jgi:uncharacterized protein (TIGR02246 family)
MESDEQAVRQVLNAINRAWLEGRAREMARLLHSDIVMALPGFAGQVRGRDAVVEGFAEFCANARVEAWEEEDADVHVAGGTAVASFAYAMRYALGEARYRVTGRDLWVFAREEGGWAAVWRTMLDTAEEPATD